MPRDEPNLYTITLYELSTFKPVDVTVCVGLARDESNDLDFDKCALHNQFFFSLFPWNIMSDDQFAFLKTGFGGTESNSTSDDAYNTFVTGAQNILLLFAEDAVRTAGRYVQATGRRNVTKRDMKMALQYEAVHLWFMVFK